MLLRNDIIMSGWVLSQSELHTAVGLETAICHVRHKSTEKELLVFQQLFFFKPHLTEQCMSPYAYYPVITLCYYCYLIQS